MKSLKCAVEMVESSHIPSTLRGAGRVHLSPTHSCLSACVHLNSRKGEADGGEFVRQVIWPFVLGGVLLRSQGEG